MNNNSIQTGNSATRASGNIQGMVWILLASAVFAINFTLIRKLGAEIHAFELVFFRNLFGFLFLIPFLVRSGRQGLVPARPGLMALRGLMQTFALLFWYWALIVTPFAMAVSLSLLEPIFASIIAILVLREKSSPARWAVVIVGLAGSLIIIRPGFQAVSLGALAALGSAVFWGVFLIVGKVQTRVDSVISVVAYPTLLVVPLALFPASFVWQWPSLEQYFWLFMTGVLSSVAGLMFAKAYQVGEVTAVAPMSFSRLIFAAIVGFVFFSEIPEIWVWAGGAVIIAAGIYLGRIEARLARVV
ncbi:MAG: DMT family transporter [Rhodospirillaceae bacterium]|nr:DMT family transporter [Rhodospirillaceae bacterium]